MVGNTFNRYIWLLNILLQKKRLTYEEIKTLWESSSFGGKETLPHRTFHQHRKAVENLFGVKILCNQSDGNHYYIADPEKINNNKTRQWLLGSFSLSNIIAASHNMDGRILFESIPGGVEHLQPIIEAMQRSKILEIDYQPFGGHRNTYHVETYAMKVYHQRWYMVGRLQELDAVRHLALDRILDLQTTDKPYVVPEWFDARKFYANAVGIFVGEDYKPQKVRIRAFGKQVDYLRSLPLHEPQAEPVCQNGLYSEFEYKLCLTPELETQLLAMGETIEVLEPLELRERIKKRLTESLRKYQ